MSKTTKALLFLSAAFCLTAEVDAQKNKTSPDEEVRQERVEQKTERVEVSREQPRQEEPRRSDPPPVESRREESRREESRSNDSAATRSERRQEKAERREPISEAGSWQRDRRPRREEVNDEPRQRPRKPGDSPEKPVENPDNGSTTPPPNTTTPPPAGNQDRDQRDNRNNRDGRRRGYRNRTVDYFPLPTSTVSYPSSTSRFSVNEYFDKDDVFFNIYEVTKGIGGYAASFFEEPLRGEFEPLYYTYVREFYRTEFRFVASDWTVYYEPDLDDIYIDLSKFGANKFERMLLVALGKTAQKVSKKFNGGAMTARPVLVEKIPEIGADKLYSFSVRDLPKGEYELRMLARDGSMLKHFIKLK